MSSADDADPAWPVKFCAADAFTGAQAALPRPWVFTNGVFDLLHRGHVAYLQAARQLGSTLIVALNSDASVRSLGKGPDRPIQPLCDRAWVMAALECVSIVTAFDEHPPLAVLRRIRPDVYVKGGDYDVARLPEAECVAQWGGTALALPFVAGRSSSALIDRIRTPRTATAAPPHGQNAGWMRSRRT